MIWYIQYHMIKAELQGICEGSSYCKLYKTYSNKFSEVFRYNLNKVWSGKSHDSWYCSLFSTIAWGWSICQFTMRVKIHWTCVSAKLVEWWITPKKSTSHVKHSLMWPHGSTCVSDHPHPFPPSASMSPQWAPSRDRSLSRYPAD